MSNEEQLSQLRSHWQLPAAAQFLLSFKDAFGIEKISTDDLEIALIGYSGTAWISDLFSKLLRALTLNRNISFSNWEEYLNKEYNKRQSEDNPFTILSVTSFFELPLERKLLALHHLCEWQLADPERFRLHLNENEKDSSDWRVDPIGLDASGCKYWLFDDNRLYKESPFTVPAKTTKARAKSRRTLRANSQGASNVDNLEPTWELIARTSNEWTEVADSFRKPRGLQEKHLASSLSAVLPSVLENLEQSEQERKHQEALANRKRSSRILVKELERAELVRLAEIRRESRAEYRRSTITARKDDEDRKKRAEARELRVAEREKRIQDQHARNSRRDQAAKRAQAPMKSKATPSRSSRGVSASTTISVDVEDEGEVEEEDEDWMFDCICGKYGEKLDDGLPMIERERCNVWQHIACVKEAHTNDPAKFNSKEWEDVDYYCVRCREQHSSRTTSEATTPCSDQYDPSMLGRKQRGASGASEGEGTDYLPTLGAEKHYSSSVSSSASSHSPNFVAASHRDSDESSMTKRELKDDYSCAHVSNVKKIKLFSSSAVTNGRSPVPATRQCAQFLDPVQAPGRSDNTRSNAYSTSYMSSPHEQHNETISVSPDDQATPTMIKEEDHSSLLEKTVLNGSLTNKTYAHGAPYEYLQIRAPPINSPTKPAYQGHPYPPPSLSSRAPSCPIPPVLYDTSPVPHPHHPTAHYPNSTQFGYGNPILDPAYHNSGSAYYPQLEDLDRQQHNYQQSPSAPKIHLSSYSSPLRPAHPSSHTPYPVAHASSQYDSVVYDVYSNPSNCPAPLNGLLPNNDGFPPSLPIPGQNHPLHPFPTPHSGPQQPNRTPANEQVPPRD